MSAYESAVCPIPDCDGDLWITWHGTRPVYLDDTTLDLAAPADAYTSNWEIGCPDGHIVLLPLGCSDNEVFGGSDSDDEISVEQKDLARLHRLLAR